MFEGISFIRSAAVNDGSLTTYAPMFRRNFRIDHPIKKATLYICGLGYVYSWFNGKKTSEDLFTAPVSNYTKTLWYNEYDVTALLHQGENVFAAICGNGWYNEVMFTGWDFDKAPWRDTPKLIMTLVADGETLFSSDDQFLVSLQGPVLFNQLRSGEHFDSRLYDPHWTELSYDDSRWDRALIDRTPPTGIFRACKCEPIRECGLYPTKKIIRLDEKTYIFDIGQNISGYVRLNVCQKSGDILKISYAEELREDNSLQRNNIDAHYPETEFQTDYFICNGQPFVWSPTFAYHGFRYIQVEGIENPTREMVSGVFVHQDIDRRSRFYCSDNTLNQLFHCGIMASYSNMFYLLTDCPTREKFGWTNDARASSDQMLTNFKTEKLFEKWMTDIRDAMRDDGSMPGIIPSSGWGYHWGNGPVSDGVLFEMAYQVYLHTGRATILRENFPWFRRYLAYMDSLKDENGDVTYGLPDWASPQDSSTLPTAFINRILQADFLKVTALSARLNGLDDTPFLQEREALIREIKARYIDADGKCIYPEMAGVAMLIYYDFYDSLPPLKQQLAQLIRKQGGNHNCGMVGLRHLLLALNKCDMCQEAYHILTSPEYPSHAYWLSLGATTLWEKWDVVHHTKDSRNHHMYSDFMSWIIKTFLGIAPMESHPGYQKVSISPRFIDALSFAEGWVDTVSGKIQVSWIRKGNAVHVELEIPEGMEADYKGHPLQPGKHSFTEHIC